MPKVALRHRDKVTCREVPVLPYTEWTLLWWKTGVATFVVKLHIKEVGERNYPFMLNVPKLLSVLSINEGQKVVPVVTILVPEVTSLTLVECILGCNAKRPVGTFLDKGIGNPCNLLNFTWWTLKGKIFNR